MSEIETETAIIGGGQAGVPLARALAAAGRQVVLIERMHLGGSCVNFGCTPSKAVIASARLAADARRAASLGVIIPNFEVDFAQVMERARRLVAQAKGELDESLSHEENLQLITAHARFEGRGDRGFVIRAGDMLILAKQVVLDTGARTARPPIPGLDNVPIIDAEDWIALRDLPRHILMVGGSYIALEMSQAFRRLGSSVTILQKASQLAEREDPDVADTLAAALKEDGCQVRLNVEIRRVEPMLGGLRVWLEDDAIEGSHLFLAAGRQPNTDELGLESVNIRPDENGIIKVDEQLRTPERGLWAAGDIRGGPAFTHTAYDDFRVLRSQFLGDSSDRRGGIVPYAMFTDPELGRVGLNETEARKAGKRFKVGLRRMTDSGKARELGKTAGFIKVIVDATTDDILGATALCEHGSEIVQLFVELMNSGATARTVRDAIHIHPTLAEAAKNAVVDVIGEGS
jgi:pyruvate/2-oxoglutarate dehydrogenase complex dihydrolipoamide dehydrogenase (E3) component